MIALLPACTAVFAVLRAGEQPSRGFWLAAGAGLVAVLAFIASQGLGEIGVADLELLAGTVVCALAYAEGGALSRTLGGPQTICWALVLAAPLTIPSRWRSSPAGHVGTNAWLGFAYVGVISMFLGFFAWYAGLALGGVAKAGQTQLLQTPLTLVLAGAGPRRAHHGAGDGLHARRAREHRRDAAGAGGAARPSGLTEGGQRLPKAVERGPDPRQRGRVLGRSASHRSSSVLPVQQARRHAEAQRAGSSPNASPGSTAMSWRSSSASASCAPVATPTAARAAAARGPDRGRSRPPGARHSAPAATTSRWAAVVTSRCRRRLRATCSRTSSGSSRT